MRRICLISLVIFGLLLLTTPQMGLAQQQGVQSQGIIKTGTCQYTVQFPGVRIDSLEWVSSDGFKPSSTAQQTIRHCLSDPLTLYTLSTKVRYNCTSQNDNTEACQTIWFTLSTYGNGESDNMIDQIKVWGQQWMIIIGGATAVALGLWVACTQVGLCRVGK